MDSDSENMSYLLNVRDRTLHCIFELILHFQSVSPHLFWFCRVIGKIATLLKHLIKSKDTGGPLVCLHSSTKCYLSYNSSNIKHYTGFRQTIIII